MTQFKNKTAMPKHRRKGYILMTVVILIAIVGVMSVNIANRGLKVALETSQAKEALQRRWGSYSCRRTLLGSADKLLGRTTKETGNNGDLPQTESATEDEAVDPESPKLPERFRKMSFTLGSLDFEVMVADENAKINLNAVYSNKGKTGVLGVLEKHKGLSGDITCRFRPYRVSRQGQYPAFDSWGQLYDIASSDRRKAIRSIQEASENITCWGNQQLNFHVATDKVLLETSKMFVSSSSARKLVDFRKQNPTCEIDDALDNLGLSEREYQKLERLFCNESTCWSLWIHCQPAKKDSSSWKQFSLGHNEFGIIEGLENNKGHIQQFVW